MPSKLPQGVAFDLDGTLLDTERLAKAGFRQACEDFQLPYQESLYNRCVGSTHDATERYLQEDFGVGFDYATFSQCWKSHYYAMIEAEPVPIKEGIVPLIERLQDRDIPMVVVTSSHRKTVEWKLGIHELNDRFEFLVCGDEVEIGKPDPWPYLHAMERLNLSPEVCWAIEDSGNGVRSASSAGMVVYQIPDLIPPSNVEREMGHEILSSALDLLPRLA